MPQQSESRDLDKVIVRLPDGMRDKLKASAAASKRSLNAEIVARLSDTLENDDILASPGAHPEAMARVAEMMAPLMEKFQRELSSRMDAQMAAVEALLRQVASLDISDADRGVILANIEKLSTKRSDRNAS